MADVISLENARQGLPTQALLEEVKKVGFLPFILVRAGGHAPGGASFVACKTQNDAGQFVNDLAALPGFTDSKLVRGIERALSLEVYEAADLLFSWVHGPATPFTETVYILRPDGGSVHARYNYPAFGFDCGEGPQGPEPRTQLLLDTFHTYAGNDGNNALRFAIMEALAFALSRALGARQRYGQALQVVEQALAVSPYSIHLKACKHTLLLKLDGKPVPPRLEKFVGEDNGYLKQFVCPLPFERFDIGPSGDVLVCCGHWLPTSIGNFIKDPVDGVLNSARAHKIRESMTDGSYKYCNHLECGTMAQGSLPRREDLHHPRTRKAVAEQNYRLDGVDEIMFAFDQTCNLSCPSCRTHRITEKASQTTEKVKAVEEKLLPLLPSLRILHINPAGELFGSRPSRKLLELIDDTRCPELVLDIISNGTLFSEAEWNKFPGIHNKVRSVRISIDAASKETFETLRRLGVWDVFVENMRFLRRLRSSGVIPQLKFSFTYQLGNFREMRAFVDFCDEMLADFAIFERLQNIAFTHEEYKARAVHYPDHAIYAEFIEVIRDPVFRTKRVWHDFDYPGVENMPATEARERLAGVQSIDNIKELRRLATA
jgi:hypothetical protein